MCFHLISVQMEKEVIKGVPYDSWKAVINHTEDDSEHSGAGN